MPDRHAELIEKVPELRPTKRGGRRRLVCNPDFENWWWRGGDWMAEGEDIDVAHALFRERAVRCLGERGGMIHFGNNQWVCDVRRVGQVVHSDFDTFLRLAVEAVHASQKGD